MKQPLTPCAERRESICLLSCGLLDDEAGRGLTEHLATCLGCKEYYEGIRSVSDNLAKCAERLESVAPSAAAEDRWRRDFETAIKPCPSESKLGHTLFDWCRDMIRARRLVCGALAAVWLVLLAMNVSFRGRSHTMASKSSRPSPEFVRAFLKGE
jgi:uncharacterized membrane protein YgcG